MEADQAPAPAAVGNDDVRPLPYESVVARAVFQRNHKSVVRLRVAFETDKDGKDRFGCGTGFIVLSNERHMVIMSCSHSFANWDKNTYVEVMFHGGEHALADVALLRKERELALLLVDFSASPGFSNADGRHPQVTLAHADARKGDFLVMLGYPYSSSSPAGGPELGTFHGSVTNETTIIKGLELLSADYPAAPGASGSPVFGVYGDDHRVVGLCKGGRRGVAYTVPVSCIRDTLKTARGATGWPENATILEMLQLWLASIVPAAAAAAAGDPGAGQPRRTRPRQGPPGSGAAGPSSSKAQGIGR